MLRMSGTRRFMFVWLPATVLLLMISPASADLLLYEGFDYTEGSLGGLTGGTGDWTDGWSGTNYNVAAGSLSLPNMPFAVTGGHASGSNNTNRNFTGVSSTVDGTYYLSYLVQRTGFDPNSTSGQWADAHLRTSSFYRSITGTATSSHKLGVQADNQSLTSIGGDGMTEDPFFFVLKIVVNASGVDQVYGNVYSDGALIPASEPIGWSYEVLDANITADMSKVTLWAGTASGYSAQYDEIRLATTYEEAVPVPEPVSFAIGAVGLLGMSIRRTRRRDG